MSSSAGLPGARATSVLHGGWLPRRLLALRLRQQAIPVNNVALIGQLRMPALQSTSAAAQFSPHRRDVPFRVERSFAVAPLASEPAWADDAAECVIAG